MICILLSGNADTVMLKFVVFVTSPSVYETVTVLFPVLVELNPVYPLRGICEVTFLVEPSLYVAVTTIPVILSSSPI